MVTKKKFDNTVESLTKRWRKKAIERYRKLMEQNRIKNSILYYTDIIGKTWEQTLYKYMGIKTETLAPLKTKSVKGFISDTVFNVFLSKTYVSIAKPSLVEVERKVNSKPEIYFSLLQTYQVETLYLKSFIR